MAADVLPTLRDPVAQAHFERDGIVVVPVLTPDEARDLRRRAVEIVPAGPFPFFDLFRSDPPDVRKQVDRLVRGALEARATDLLVDHDIWAGAVLVKPPGPEGEIGLHTDWNFVDESRYRSGLLWLALDDTVTGNGGIHVVPGTNRLPIPPRGNGIHFGFDDPATRDAIAGRTISVDVPIGHAAVWDNRLLHGSGPNRTDGWRMAASLGFKPRQARLHHHRCTPDGVLHRYALEREFFLDYEPFDPDGILEGPHVLDDEVWAPEAYEVRADEVTALGPVHPVHRMGPAPAAAARKLGTPRRPGWLRRRVGAGGGR